MKEPKIRIENIEDMKVIYIRFRGTYVEFRKKSRSMFNKLFEFAKNNDLVVPNVTKVITIYHDNPFITDEKNLRTSVAMTVPSGKIFEEQDDISSMTITGKFGVGQFDINAKEYGTAWEYMYNEWLFKSEYKPRDSFPFELYVTEPPKNFKDSSITEIYIPLE